jgi:hypothetical protein
MEKKQTNGKKKKNWAWWCKPVIPVTAKEKKKKEGCMFYNFNNIPCLAF